jgi:transglutaminase-like putative cysteine protease
MAALALDGSKDITVRTLAMNLTSGALQKDYRTEACLCLGYCRDQVRYVQDIRTVEVLQTPNATLRLNGGDCDDKATLLAAMLGSIGHRVRFIAISFTPGQYSHVWVQDFVEGKWLDLEPTEPVPCGARIPDSAACQYLTLEV